ncbi:protein phosphatase 2C domain-containing protein [Actinomadura barringtoniae]|uniref:Protein phosphatase 2C domain-containing protein n=2 Tax=Actinomadura barringtoniae TaxID=1427535 RepID=A0A939PAW4_9ACTN|nr:protein phosphatase 2C domain-containing protein [Actinomadura barringtoniae]
MVSGNGATICPDCGELVQARDRFCEECGRPSDLVVAGAAFKAAAPACTDCGAAAVSPDGYCEQCGMRQPNGREHIEIALEGERNRVPAAGISDRGLRRSRNEDALALVSLPGRVVCAVVCDGVATAPGSEEAAQLAAETGVSFLARRLTAGAPADSATRSAAGRAARAVAGLGGADHNSPACTYVSLVVDADTVTVGWVGDSRAYWLANGSSALLTEDDSWAVQKIARGELSTDEALADPRAHLLTGWLGADAGHVEAHVRTFVPAGPGLVLACSDGLWNYLPDPPALTAAASGEGDPLGAARRLVQAALDGGGHDNVTVALIPFPPTDSSQANATAEHSRENRR